MARNYLELSMGPVDELDHCPQVGEPNYRDEALEWCNRYVELLRRLFPLYEQYNVQFKTKSNPHDFGTYYEVIVEYFENTEGESYALYVENCCPVTWEDTKVEITWEAWGRYHG